MALRANRSAHARGRADHADRLAAQRRALRRPRYPVDRVLQPARDTVVVLRNAEYQAIGLGDRRLELDHTLWIFEIAVEDRQLDAVVQRHAGAGRERVAHRRKQGSIERGLAQAAADPEKRDHPGDRSTDAGSTGAPRRALLSPAATYGTHGYVLQLE